LFNSYVIAASKLRSISNWFLEEVRTQRLQKKENWQEPGLPDFSRCNLPKMGNTIPNEHKMYQMALKYTTWQ
jgi:hypothetical protein